MQDKIEKKRLAILRVLRNAGKPIASKTITDELQIMGYDISPRTIRFHLKYMDDEGLTKYSEKHGRYITEKGIKRLDTARVYEKVGFLNARIDQMAMRMNFDLQKRSGTVIINVSYVRREDLPAACRTIMPYFKTGFSMGELVTLYPEGDIIGRTEIPAGYVGIGTVCSFTLNGIIIKSGIPLQSRFGGLLEIEGGEPVRFVEIINYNGTSIDPLEIFVRSGMTDLSGAADRGAGRIGANFFEVPAESRTMVTEISEETRKIGLGGLFRLSYPEHPLLEIPIHVGRVGGIAIGGLNPLAALREHNIWVKSHAVSDVTDFSSLFHYTELPSRAGEFI